MLQLSFIVVKLKARSLNGLTGRRQHTFEFVGDELLLDLLELGLQRLILGNELLNVFLSLL